MKSILYNTRPTLTQMYLDPRSKILLCITVSFVMMSSNNTGIMRYILPCLATIPLIAFMILKKISIAIYYVALYIISMTIPSIFTKVLPGMSMFWFLILTTTVSEFVAAMESLHISKKFIVPVSVMFRFFPTIAEEYSAIRDAMKLRNVGYWRNPIEMMEYRMVPLLMSLLTIGNELSASALTRGLDTPIQRTNICPIGFHWQDGVVVFFCVVIIGIYILSSLMGW